MAADAVAGGGGVDVDGYRDNRGVEVVGAWRWLDEYGFGLATEIDVDEAYAPLATPRAALAGLLVLLVAALGLAGAASLQVARLVRDVRRAQRLGQYTLEELIGQGGSGQVWRARHALLQRPTAVKLVRPDALGPEALLRFEREVQITARLTHPNTIEIYDYGRTEEGLFFYAMELLHGTSLQHLVSRHGAQPTARAVHLLRQLCASLAEAHEAGLVHRDVKPANAKLCRLGGQFDVLKVLDFGLVKDLAAPAVEATASLEIAGTPLYMAPERLRPGAPVDARCDVWAVGATAYKLLTGRDLWSGDVSDVFVKILTTAPPRCAWAAPGVPAALDELVAECLAADPARRPADARVLLARLDALEVAPWTQGDAVAWWSARAGTEAAGRASTGALSAG
jgi:serine/threonine-protein kinase